MKALKRKAARVGRLVENDGHDAEKREEERKKERKKEILR